MSIRDELPRFSDLRPKLTVIGVGGAGCNAINNMIASGLTGVDFIVANTDAQALAAAATDLRIQLGVELTEGLGAGSRPEIGEAAAEEAIEDIRNHIKGSHMVFIAAGMGGGTGTGAASVIARVARELGILTVGVVTKPFLFEGARRMRVAEAGVADLRNYVDTLIVIPNQNLFRIASERTTFAEAFVMADQVLYSGVACIVDLILKEGLINLDFADVRTVMTGMGTAMMGTGEASGERRATIAAEEAIANPLLDDVSLRGAKGLLLSITGGANLTLYDVDEAASRVRQEVDPEANIIVGATYDASLGDRVRVSIVASGMSRTGEAERCPPAPAEEWIRASQAAATAQGRPGQPSQYGRPPEPDRASATPPHDHAGGGAQDLQRRLTEALRYGPAPSGSGAGPQRPPAPSGYEASRGRGAEQWRGPGNVLIEEGPPQLQAASTPPPLPPDYAAAHEPGAFAPQPPAEVRRQPQPPSRRMPEVDDFPPVAQRAYRTAETGHAEPPPPPPASRQQRPVPHPEPRRRLGLFERLAGRVRGGVDSLARNPAASEAYPHAAHSNPAEAGHHDGYEQYAHVGESYDADGQGVELPVFFRERRR